MKQLVFILIIILSYLGNAQECNYLGVDKKFENGDTTYLFGDNVRLRSLPSSDSEIIATLKIGTPLQIVALTDITETFNGIRSPWYKVRYNNETGYVLGGLISMTKVEEENVNCFVNLEQKESIMYIVIRVVSTLKPNYIEHKSLFLGDNNGFCIKLYNNRGVEGIRNIIQVNYLPESCGANSGGYYLFYNDTELHKVIDLTSRGEIGYWESENIYFPSDELGEKNKIIYIKENGQDSEDRDSEFNWEKSSKMKIKLEWKNNSLTPNPKKIKREDLN
ncbi:SH3 domain-containing protein [Cellulophaga sp. 20_2_10]|uniref:SH3 domain-containing protein n=1 Tax=Cellulophaga sp. 20_2_10 TaxID=2942476 RepID=UPI00201AFB46|nr:SH3 domain-containing protein [Cellulophaga sp. 20_2_10]MCL5244272.1 SH3 domain-containing protein [Cellulophaga sp. 20_2_10]